LTATLTWGHSPAAVVYGMSDQSGDVSKRVELKRAANRSRGRRGDRWVTPDPYGSRGCREARDASYADGGIGFRLVGPISASARAIGAINEDRVSRRSCGPRRRTGRGRTWFSVSWECGNLGTERGDAGTPVAHSASPEREGPTGEAHRERRSRPRGRAGVVGAIRGRLGVTNPRWDLLRSGR
jgi:hypothetical protein